MSKYISIGLFYRPLAAKTPVFAVFGLRHLVMLTVGGNLIKLNTGAQHYKPSPIQRHQNHFCIPTSSWWNLAHKLWRSRAWHTEKAWQTKSVTDRQKTQRFSPPRRRVKSDRHQTWHGDRGPRARSFTSKMFGVWRIVSPANFVKIAQGIRPCEAFIFHILIKSK